MILRWQNLLGILIGLVLAAGILGLWQSRGTRRPGPMIADYGGPLRSITLQYTRGAEFTWPIYREFLRWQSPELNVRVICPDEPDFVDFKQHVDVALPHLRPLFTHHRMTPWSRDRWLLLAASADAPATLLAPRGELLQETWPERAGDSRIAQDIASELSSRVVARRSGLYFDAGDFLADGPYVFVSPAVLRRNLQHTVETREALVEALRLELGREPVLLDAAPDHHLGMYMMSAGNNTLVVADPSLGQPLFATEGETARRLPGGADFSSETQKRFDSVAEAAQSKGFRVIRIPVVPSRDDSKVYLTYVNVLLDVRDGKPIVFMPTYSGQEHLNAATQQIWESLGYAVRPIDCTTAFIHGGTLHCMVNVLERQSH